MTASAYPHASRSSNAAVGAGCLFLDGMSAIHERVSDEAEQRALLVELANTAMPFGKYEGVLLVDLPEAYLAWFARQGFPRGKLGMLLESALSIKMNGLDGLVRPLIERR